MAEEILTEVSGTEADLLYKLDGVNFLDFGVYVSESNGIIDGLAIKEPQITDWFGQHGQVVDLEAPRYQAREIELECFVYGSNKLEFYEKVRAFIQAFQKIGLRTLDLIIANKPLRFMVFVSDSMPFSKKWNAGGMVGTFSLKLKEPSPIKRLLKYNFTSDPLDNTDIESTWNSVCYGGGKFIAVANDSTYRVMTSSNAVIWTARSSVTNSWYGVCFGNGLFVAVENSGSGSQVMTSTDGIIWTSRTAASANPWYSVCYGNGLFVAVATSGTNQVMTSTDGITWTSRTASAVKQWKSICYGGGKFVAVADDNGVMTSVDGITWTNRTSAASNSWYGVTYSNSLFVAVSYDGSNRVMTSPDGITWTARSCPSQSWSSVTYGKGIFVAVAFSGTGNRVMTSPDGVIWTSRTSAADNNWRSITFGGGLFVAVSRDGTNRVMSSSDGINWIDNSTPLFELNFTSPNALDIYWGDETVDNDVFGEDLRLTHEYTVEGEYLITIAGAIEEITNFETTAEVLWNKY